jgi:hypothetical protein
VAIQFQLFFHRPTLTSNGQQGTLVGFEGFPSTQTVVRVFLDTLNTLVACIQASFYGIAADLGHDKNKIAKPSKPTNVPVNLFLPGARPRFDELFLW